MKKPKVLLVDDHQMVRDGFKSLLLKEKSCDIIEEAGNGKEALEILKTKSFDLVLMDISMPEMDGIECTEKISQLYPQTKVLAITMQNEEQHIRKMLKAGAAGYILKNSGKEELLNAIRTILSSENYFSEQAKDVIMRDLLKSEEKKKKVITDIYITNREKDVLKLIVKEFNNQEIADKLFISIRTVDAHRRNLLQKTGSRNAVGLVKFAIETSIFDE
jgi:DNA-binding NarL/FixJ family response regulator